MLRWLYAALIIHCVDCSVAESCLVHLDTIYDIYAYIAVSNLRSMISMGQTGMQGAHESEQLTKGQGNFLFNFISLNLSLLNEGDIFM
jgi:hypothetical protein